MSVTLISESRQRRQSGTRIGCGQDKVRFEVVCITRSAANRPASTSKPDSRPSSAKDDTALTNMFDFNNTAVSMQTRKHCQSTRSMGL
eukprot:304131-Rhodomonas_salina.5